MANYYIQSSIAPFILDQHAPKYVIYLLNQAYKKLNASNHSIQTSFIIQFYSQHTNRSISWIHSYLLKYIKVSESLSYQVSFYMRGNSKLLNDISQIYFPYLKSLDLSSCFIDNIESITWINCERMQKLILKQNKLSSLKPLAKTNWKHLQYLNLLSNCSGDRKVDSLSRLRTKIFQGKMSSLKQKSFNKNKNSITMYVLNEDFFNQNVMKLQTTNLIYINQDIETKIREKNQKSTQVERQQIQMLENSLFEAIQLTNTGKQL